jgi:hypothetical protein
LKQIKGELWAEVVGGKVTAKAIYVTNTAQSKRRYGSLWKNKWVAGVVVECVSVRKPYRLATYDFGEGVIKPK